MSIILEDPAILYGIFLRRRGNKVPADVILHALFLVASFTINEKARVSRWIVFSHRVFDNWESIFRASQKSASNIHYCHKIVQSEQKTIYKFGKHR